MAGTILYGSLDSTQQPRANWLPLFKGLVYPLEGYGQMQRSVFAKIAANEPGAVEECLDRFGDLIWSMAVRYSFGRSEAEDLVQEIFVELWRHANRFNELVASETIFVTMIARRRLIDFARKRKRTLSTSPISEELHDSKLSIEAVFCLNEDAEWAREQINRLPPNECEVLTMAIDDGLSHSQIAERLGLPLGTVKTTARRALIQLRALYRSFMRDKCECLLREEVASHGVDSPQTDQQGLAP